jgi:riboflavin biosynthesis pyrimidine reductase
MVKSGNLGPVMNVIWYTAMSMDGRIADGRESLDFLETIGRREAAQAEFPTFLATIDAVIVGASTLRWLLRGGHGWPHDDLPTWLVSHDAKLVAEIGQTRGPLRRVDGPLGPMFEEIERAGHKRVWLAGGGSVAGQALALDRVDEVIATVAPTAIGAGPALFDARDLPPRRFRLAECRALGGDAARLRWLRDR